MSKVAISEEYLTDIADSIREKLGSQDTYKVSEMSEAIDSITGGGGDIDWSAIGYESTPQSIIDDYDYSIEIKNNWVNESTLYQRFLNDTKLVYMPLVDTSNAQYTTQMFNNCVNLTTIPLLNTSNVTAATQMFSGCARLTTIPLLDLSNCTNTQNMFSGCTDLTTIPLLNTSNVTTMRNMFASCSNLKDVPLLNASKVVGMNSFSGTFTGCPKLTDTSLDNILQMCIGATSYTSTKTLVRLGLTSTDYPTNRIQALPHYQDFINAGWTIGY